RWREPFVGIAIGAACALLADLGWPLVRPISDLAASKLPKTVTDAAAWPSRGNLSLAVALSAVAVLLVKPLWRQIARIVRSWSVGLVSGIIFVSAIASFLCLIIPASSRLFHSGVYVGVAVAFALVTVLVSARNRADLDRVGIIRRLNLPRDQIQQMR